MTAAVLSGKDLAHHIRERAANQATDLAGRGIKPYLAVVVATDDGSTLWYVRSIERACANAGMGCSIVDLGPNATEELLRSVLTELSDAPAIHGIILQTPLPQGVQAERLVTHIAPEKDVDGANPLSLGRLAVGQEAFAPATARAVIELLEYHAVPIVGAHVTVVGRSAVVGKPLALLLLQKDATITVCHSRSGALERYTRDADIVAVAAGRVGLLTGEHVSPQSVVIDVGTNVLADGSLVGDVDAGSVSASAAGLSPVPGGVGSVTTALLLLHTVEAAEKLSGAGEEPTFALRVEHAS